MFVVTEPRVEYFLNTLASHLDKELNLKPIWDRGWGYLDEDPIFWLYHFTSTQIDLDLQLEIKLLFSDGTRGYILEGFRFGVWCISGNDYSSVTTFDFREISTVEDFKVAFMCCFETFDKIDRSNS